MNDSLKPYREWIAIAERWDKVVDFGSPITAWTQAMLREYRIAREEKRPPDMKNCK